jgi:hypothetical protein
MKKELARDLATLALEYVAKLDATIETLRKSCPEDEFRRYAGGIGQVLEHLHQDILGPIFCEHPELDPRDPKRG